MPTTYLRRRILRRVSYMRRNRCSVLLAGLLLFILSNPLLASSRIGATALNVGLLGVLTIAVWALKVRWVSVLGLGALGIATLVAIMNHRFGGESAWLRPAALVLAALFVGAVTVALLRYVLDRRVISTDKVFGAVSAYVLIAFTFTLFFGLLQIVQPHAFHVSIEHDDGGVFGWMTMMYFAFTVLTSTGFGEITPVTDMARSLIVIEQVLGVMYVAFLVARLANLYGGVHRR